MVKKEKVVKKEKDSKSLPPKLFSSPSSKQVRILCKLRDFEDQISLKSTEKVKNMRKILGDGIHVETNFTIDNISVCTFGIRRNQNAPRNQ